MFTDVRTNKRLCSAYEGLMNESYSCYEGPLIEYVTQQTMLFSVCLEKTLKLGIADIM